MCAHSVQNVCNRYQELWRESEVTDIHTGKSKVDIYQKAVDSGMQKLKKLNLFGRRPQNLGLSPRLTDFANAGSGGCLHKRVLV